MSDLTQDLLQKYATHGPRYTSYPTAPIWNESFGTEAFQEHVRESNHKTPPTPLSLYVHLPFCESRCLFCGCNVVITQQRDQAEKYLGYLFQEIDQVAVRMATERPVVQFHWGGGTPTYLSPQQMERLFTHQTKNFQLAPGAEVAIEVDPRVTTSEQIQLLKDLGFNRISLGVQDFNPQVQQAIHRIQPASMTEEMVGLCRSLAFESINFDLIYGLPHQTVTSFQNTLAEVIRMSPDRIALYHYAHVPWLSPHQNQLDEASLPESTIKLQIFQEAIETLTHAGYVYIGMDHFAKPQDELTLAQQKGTLRRNFMGYTTDAQSEQESELYGFGVSAISALHQAYAQNWRKLSEYYNALESGQWTTMRGYELSAEDHLRRAVIKAILCHGQVDYSILEASFGLSSFTRHFSRALEQLPEFEADGLIVSTSEGFTLTPLGRIFSRNIAMLFDAYLEEKPTATSPLFSKTA